MPIIYGKGKNSTIHDLKAKIEHKWEDKTINEVTYIYFEYWHNLFKDIKNLMVLIQSVGWVAYRLNDSLYYGNIFFTTIQRYVVMDEKKLSVYYDRARRKKI